MSEIYSKPEKHFLILGTIFLLLLPEIANYRNYSSGMFDRNVEFLERECLQGSMIKNQTIYYDKTVDCEERAKWLANSWSDLLVPVIGLIIFWWWFLGTFTLGVLRMIPFFDSFILRNYNNIPPSSSGYTLNTKPQENLKKAKSILQSQTYDKENITIGSGRKIVKVNTDGPDGYHSKEKDVTFRYRNCMDIIQKNHLSKGDITTFFIYFGKGYVQFKENYPNITINEAITILKWPIPLLNKIYKTEKEKTTAIKRRKQIRDLIKKIEKSH